MTDEKSKRLQGLLADLEADRPLTSQDRAFFEALADAAPQDEEPNSFGWARLQKAMKAESQTPPMAWYRQARIAPWQMAASVAAAAMLGVFAAPNLAGNPSDDAGYTLASETTQAPSLQVVFAPEATTEDLAYLLPGLGLEITGGPSRLGIYELRRLNAEPMGDELVETLREHPLVETAELRL